MKKIIVFLFTLLVIVSIIPIQELNAAYEVLFDVSANAVYFANLDTDVAVYQKNSREKIYPASVTKIMTAVLALENIDNINSEHVICEPEMLEEFQYIEGSYSNAGIRNYEDFTVKDLLYAILLASASDAADVLAAHVGGSIPGFVDMMNAKAKELGMNNTHFMNPHGLHDPEHYTTAYDLYLLAKYAIKVPGFMEIAESNIYQFKTNKRPNGEYFITTNYLQDQNRYPDLYYKYLKGLKTGTTDEAGSCLISTASKNGYTYLLVLMGEPLSNPEGEEYNPKLSFIETPKFYDWAFNTFTIKELVPENNVSGEIPLKLCWEKTYLRLCTHENFKQLIPNSYEASSIRLINNTPKFINAPVKEGDLIGTTDVVLSGEVIGTLNLYSADTVERSNTLYVLEILQLGIESFPFKIGVISFSLFFIFFITASINARKNRKKKAIDRIRRRK